MDIKDRITAAEEMPDYLYHYTSIDNLALILKNRTIRFSPLDKMDDLQEAKTSDLKNAGQFVFVSSWTDEADELIPMWKMYADPKAGVRIKLPVKPFLRQPTYEKELRTQCAAMNTLPIKMDFVDGKYDSLIDETELLRQGIMTPNAASDINVFKVGYTRDMQLLEPAIKKEEGPSVGINFGKLGIYKNEFWSFQKEWRYWIILLNHISGSTMSEINRNAMMMVNRILTGNEPRPTNYIDLPIEPHAFSQMEIVASPQITAGYWEILKSIVDRYNPTATIKESTLKNLISI